MKVVNKTNYDTRVLRKVFHQVLRDVFKQRPTWKKRWKQAGANDHYRIAIGNRTQGSSTTGHAYLTLSPMYKGGEHHHNMFLSLNSRVEVAHLAAVFRHELWHSFGAQHGDMGDEVMWCKGGPFEHYPELLGLDKVLVHKPPKPKPVVSKRDKQAARVESLLKRRKAWVTKARRADTALKKINASLKRYEKQGHEVCELSLAAHRKAKR